MTAAVSSWWITACWTVTIGYWIAKARGNRPTVRAQSTPGRTIHALAAVGAFCIAAFGPSAYLYHPSQAVAWIGAALTAFGCGLAVAARRQLGVNWSPHASVKEGQELLESGVFAVSRHPIYTGLLGAITGTAFASGRARVFAGLAILATSFYFKAGAEEQLLEQQFGARYDRYRERVKGLIPFVW